MANFIFTRPVVLIHGYSDKGESFRPWKRALNDRGAEIAEINICNYVTLSNEVNIDDIAEGLDRGLVHALKWDGTKEFDAIVHSTGMLVLRAWLRNFNARPKRLKHLVGLAPATFGSPLAHKGRSFLGSIFKGSKQLGPDFLEAGDLVLDGLELGSSYTWNLAEHDLVCEQPFYSMEGDTPFATVFIGDTPYGGWRKVIDTPGSDGTVRWAGCGLTTRKFTVNLSRDTNAGGKLVSLSTWHEERLPSPMIGVSGATHASILSEPETKSQGSDGPTLADIVSEFLTIVSNRSSYNLWLEKAEKFGETAKAKMNAVSKGSGFQQFVVHMIDERGHGVPDYSITICDSKGTPFEDFEEDVHPYRADESFRCFHVRLTPELIKPNQEIWMKIRAASGTQLVEYHAYGENGFVIPIDESGEIELELTKFAAGRDTLFEPYTTTMLEITLNREAMPLNRESHLFEFLRNEE